MIVRCVLAPAAALVLLAAPAATAKDFQPGGLRLCNRAACASIDDRAVLKRFSSFVYGESRVRRAPSVRAGGPALALRYADGYAAALVGPATLDRFLSFGIICGRFQRGNWYRLPAALAAELRRIAGELRPLRVPKRLPPSC